MWAHEVALGAVGKRWSARTGGRGDRPRKWRVWPGARLSGMSDPLKPGGDGNGWWSEKRVGCFADRVHPVGSGSAGRGSAVSMGSGPYRVSYSRSARLSNRLRRLAANGLRMIRSRSWTTNSRVAVLQVWFTPKRSTISSRVPVTLHTFAYALRMAESSQRMLIPCSPFVAAGRSGLRVPVIAVELLGFAGSGRGFRVHGGPGSHIDLGRW